MKTYISIALVCILSWQLTAKVAVYAFWKADQAYIAQALCENRNVPESGCQGSCYLKKQLKKTELPESSKNYPLSALQKIEFSPYIFYPDFSQLALQAFITVKTTYRIYNQDKHIFLYQHRIFHPPQSIA